MTTGNTIEEFDDVGKVHAVINDDFSVVFDEGESYKQNKVGRTDVLCGPYRLPDNKDVIVNQL